MPGLMPNMVTAGASGSAIRLFSKAVLMVTDSSVSPVSSQPETKHGRAGL